jgi:integrase
VREVFRLLEKRVLPEFGHRKLTDVRRSDVQDFADRLLAEGLAASTIHNTLDPLRVLYRRALRRDLVAVDPTANLELPRPDGKRDRIAAPAEAARLLGALSDEDRPAWATRSMRGCGGASYAGCAGPTSTSRRVPSRCATHGTRSRASSKAASRSPPSAAPGWSLRCAQSLRRTSCAPAAGAPSSSSGRPRSGPSSLRRCGRRALKAWEGTAPITLHECRHTCASMFIAAGANPKVMQQIMGHASITETFKRYGHLMPGGLAEAAARVDAYLGSM